MVKRKSGAEKNSIDLYFIMHHNGSNFLRGWCNECLHLSQTVTSFESCKQDCFLLDIVFIALHYNFYINLTLTIILRFGVGRILKYEMTDKI
jgi:hypothetical protein